MNVTRWKYLLVCTFTAIGLLYLGGGPAFGSARFSYDYTVKSGDSLSAIVWKFSGRTGYRPTAAANGLADPDRIYPGQTVRIEPARPEAALRQYLEAIYANASESAYRLLSADSRARLPFAAFESALESVTRFDLDSIRLCSDFRQNGRHVAQISIALEEDPARWGFNLAWEEDGWRVLLYDRFPAFPHYDGIIGWRCRP